MRFVFAATAAALLSSIAPLSAQPSGIDGDVIDVEVMPGWRAAGMGHIAALRLTLAPGWKTYWRAPGDAGIPPSFDWQGSENLVGVVPHWPVPEIFNQNGMRSVGYDEEVIIPLMITREDPSQPVHLRAEISLGVCEEICIPAFVSIDAALPSSGAADTEISAALADRPMTEAEARVSRVTCQVRPSEDGLTLTMTVDMPPLSAGEAAVIETADPTVWMTAGARPAGG